MLEGKVLLITGGTGSFGSAVLRKFCDGGVKEIRIFSRDEKKQDDLRKKFNNDKIKFYIGDVRNLESVSEAMIGVDYVFHAAALKQVPSCEFFPMEAVRTNVLGTDNVITAAINAGVSKVVCLSTDKAAYPVNAMGVSKAMMEKVAIAKSRNIDPKDTTICVTRYGNVMASRGSVIPLFCEQIENGDEITVTDPSMTRFLMSLDEAVDLVMYAFENAKQGDLFVQKAPAGNIGNLAEAVKQVMGSDAPIKLIGTRHGEKKHETLLTKEEIVGAEDLGDYYRVPADTRDLNYSKYLSEGEEQESDIEEYNSSNTDMLSVEQIVTRLGSLEYIKHQLHKA